MKSVIFDNMDGLGGHYVSELSQVKMNIVCYYLYVESKKIKRMNIRKQKQAHRYREQTRGYQWGEQSGEGQDGGKEISYKDISYSTGNIASTP